MTTIDAASTTSPSDLFGTGAAGEISAGFVDQMKGAFASHPTATLMQNAVSETKLDKVALNRAVVTTIDHTFSNVLDEWPVTNQKQSGRCWMFAGLNMFRASAMQKMNVKEFEFSQNYTLFWDKYERANYFLEAMIDMADRDAGDRTVAYMLERPLDDGGQWNMFVNVVQKHGVVPKSAMPETESSSCTGRMNANLVHKLREGALTLRTKAAGGASVDELREEKTQLLEVIWRILCIHLGTPPSEFVWQWTDKDKKFNRKGVMTPQQFAAEYVPADLDDYVCLVHDPRATSPFGRTFTVDRLGNVVGGNIVRYLNIEMDLMKDITRRMIVDEKTPVWMGCDVGPMMQGDLGYWDEKLFDYAGAYSTEFTMNKAERLVYRQTLMTHAMLFTGCDVADDGSVSKWRVENSWGDEKGKKGYYAMNDNWYDQYMFEIAAPKRMLPAELQAAVDADPVVLPAWDPMGALAG